MKQESVIAVIGAGFSGTLAALHLLRAGPSGARILLVEKSPGFGRGLAYGTHNPSHKLNVRVGNMSAFPDEPGHLETWLGAQSDGAPIDGATFITRGVYGDYLAHLLREAVSRPDGAARLMLVSDRVVGLEVGPSGGSLRLDMGRTLPIDAAVLAVGNLPPTFPRGAGLEALPASMFAPDPWAADALKDLDSDQDVLLLGSGLTMIDVALALTGRGHIGRITALSRRGLSPHRHAVLEPFVAKAPRLAGLHLSDCVRERRNRAREIGWRAAIDELRPYSTEIWRGLSLEQRGRFLRHLRPWWDIHRHRMAPDVAEVLDGRRARGGLTVTAGRLVAAEASFAGVRASWRGRGEVALRALDVARIINCTGVGADLARAQDPLLRGLIKAGHVRPDPLGLGLEVNEDLQVVGADGYANPALFAVGPLTQGYGWETVAVPDIRNQVARLARIMASAPWWVDTPGAPAPFPQSADL